MELPTDFLSLGRGSVICPDIANFVVTKVGKRSHKFVSIIVFMSRQNLPRLAVHGMEIMLRHLKLCCDNYEMESVELGRDISKFCQDII